MLTSLLTEVEMEILGAKQTTLSEMWHQDFSLHRVDWMNKFPDFCEKLYGDKHWRWMRSSVHSQAKMYVHRIMSYIEGFPMIVDRMTSDYSGFFACTLDDFVEYIIFQDPYYRAWILMVFQWIPGLGHTYETWQISHGEDAIMFLSPEGDEYV